MGKHLTNLRSAGLAIGVAVCGCSSRAEMRAADAPSLGFPAVEDISGTSFASPEIRDYVAAVSRCLDDSTATPEWQHVPFGDRQLAGWCTGKSSRRGCPVAAQFEWERDQRVVQLPVLTDDGLKVSSIMIEALSVPEVSGWGARFTYSDPLHRGEFELRFNLFEEGKKPPIATVPLGSTLSYSVRWLGEVVGTFHVDADGPAHDELARAALSADALRDRFVPQLVALRDKVHDGISAMAAKKPVCPTRERNSLPLCRFEPFTEREQVRLRATADKEIGQWIDALESHAPELREALLRAYPVDRCWP
jgi:hypothetical protein